MVAHAKFKEIWTRHWAGLKFRLEKFGELKAYQRRKRARFNNRFPVQWLTAKQILAKDFDLYEPENSDFELSEALLKDVASDRDSINHRIWRAQIVSAVIYFFLLGTYFSVELSFEFIIKIEKKFLGLREALIFSSALIGGYAIIMQNNKYNLENFMEYIIDKKIPLELRFVYKCRYFIDKSLSRYMATNLPNLNTTSFSNFVAMFPLLFLMLAIICVIFTVVSINYFLLQDIWSNGDLGIWSKVTVIATATIFVFEFMYLYSMLLPLPYRDFSLLEKMTVLPKISPEQYDREFNDFYKEDKDDLNDMKRRGFLTEDD